MEQVLLADETRRALLEEEALLLKGMDKAEKRDAGIISGKDGGEEGEDEEEEWDDDVWASKTKR